METLSEKVDSLNAKIRYAEQTPDAVFTEGSKEDLIRLLEQEIDKLPVITDIIESAGGNLKIICDKEYPEYNNLFLFAQTLSRHVCFECGIPVNASTSLVRMHRTYCNSCMEEHTLSNETIYRR